MNDDETATNCERLNVPRLFRIQKCYIIIGRAYVKIWMVG